MTTTIAAPATKDSIAPSRAFQTIPGDHRFFSFMSIVTAVTILAGFSSTYLPKVVAGAPALPWIIHLHAMVFTSWLAFYVTQTTLVLTGRTAVHRRLGIAGVALAALMLVVGGTTAITMTRLGDRGIPGVEFPDPAGFLLLNLAAVGVFALLVAAGWYFRRNLQAHKRLMLMATASGLVGPGVSRLPFASGKPQVIGPLVLAFVFAGPVYDLVTRRRVHPAYFFSVPLALLAIPPVAAVVGATQTWHRIASMLVR
jgi:energy-converting hydrogenase Eha subunit A